MDDAGRQLEFFEVTEHVFESQDVTVHIGHLDLACP